MNISRLDAKPLGSDLWCIKGMGFSTVGGLHLFVVTESQTLVFNLQNGVKVSNSLIRPRFLGKTSIEFHLFSISNACVFSLNRPVYMVRILTQ